MNKRNLRKLCAVFPTLSPKIIDRARNYVKKEKESELKVDKPIEDTIFVNIPENLIYPNEVDYHNDLKDKWLEFVQFTRNFTLFKGFLEVEWQSDPNLAALFISFEKEPWNIFVKHRQGGFSTFVIIYAFWKAQQEKDLNIVIMYPNLGMMQEVTNFNVSEEISSLISVTNIDDSQRESVFIKFENGSKIMLTFWGDPKIKDPINILILDEAAIYMSETYWKYLANKLKKDSRVVVFSTAKKLHFPSGWFYMLWTQANVAEKLDNANLPLWHCKNNFNPTKVNYRDSFSYTVEKEEKLKKWMGEKQFRQEWLCEFI